MAGHTINPSSNPGHLCMSQEQLQPNPTGFPFPKVPAHQDENYNHVVPSHGQMNPDEAEVIVVAPKPRKARTDRHSKIRTVQGLRDRRIRLSNGVAREFFGLHDKLGFDKASMTVDWMLTQSRTAIDSLFWSSRFKDADAARSDKREDNVEKLKTRSDGLDLMELSDEQSSLISPTMIEDYCKELSEMISNN